MTIIRKEIVLLLILIIVTACGQESNRAETSTNTIFSKALADVKYLASDELGGRETGTDGNRMAREYIEVRFDSLGLQMFGDRYRQRFDQEISTEDGNTEVADAYNLIGYVEGTVNPNRYIAVTAHYDHLGERDGEIYNGADDNASGTAGLMAAARHFTNNSPDNSIIFIAFDAEEKGLAGARYFVNNPLVLLDDIVLNINMDMISTNFENELYAVGTAHYPYLKPRIEQVTENAPVNVLFGYDTDEWDQNWTLASDHGPFHQEGVPFIYFGVEDHPHYHAPSDTFDSINPEFFMNAVKTIIGVIEGLDKQLDEIIEESGR